jgi:cell division protein FtsW
MFAALVAVLAFGVRINGARRWFGAGGFGVQPSEFAKLVIVLFTAASLHDRMDRIHQPGYALSRIALVVGAACALIVLQPDYGTALSALTIAAAMVFAAGAPWRQITALVIAGVPALLAALAWEPYRLERIWAWLNPELDPRGANFQILSSLTAVGSGGVFGVGFMEGKQKMLYLPQPSTDFIFSVIAEETGLAGATAVLLCFAVIAWRGLRAAARAPDRFGALLAVGFTTMIVVQALVNMSVVLNLLPTKGIPLPMVSAGGSSFLVMMLGMGVLLNVSQQAADEP